ncbi:RTA1 domain-containing protein [Aspergillus candidus]|uniref:RTA1-domain-containing protein n=1 Tax=Aspergillus candidus TaxID=41067 RepID=A0A2I2F6Q3_ASPCN|nr:RTA1-domain-containing protein [Aspergillus candidus]PLB36248.1 RTA1-domain-containing protein [Aspergillus candidus]
MSESDIVCTLDTCPIEYGYINYQPNVAGNLFFVALYGVLLLAQLALGIFNRTWSFTIAIIPGLILEILGYLGRYFLHNNPFSFDNFLLYLICLTIAPAFFTAAIYLCLARIIIVHEGEDISRLRPRTYTIIFICCDVISLILQAAGGAVTSIADERSLRDTGVNVMIAGLAFQVVSLALFMALSLEFAYSAWRRSRRTAAVADKEGTYADVRESLKWKLFLAGLAVATITIFVRSFFRVFELKGGFDSRLANDEVALMILESGMVAIACICLTVLHPGVAMGRAWGQIKLSTSKRDT